MAIFGNVLKKIYPHFFWSKTTKILTKKTRKILVVKNRRKKCEKPYFSGEKKKCEKTLFFRREKNMSKNPTKKNFFTAKFIVKKSQKKSQKY